jgi:hypothetical protein
MVGLSTSMRSEGMVEQPADSYLAPTICTSRQGTSDPRPSFEPWRAP